jgi:hypothetical protein
LGSTASLDFSSLGEWCPLPMFLTKDVRRVEIRRDALTALIWLDQSYSR